MKQILILNGRRLVRRSVIEQDYGVHTSTIYRWIDAGLLDPPIKIGGTPYFDRQRIKESFMAEPPKVTL
jgi:predicted site-specific integrase-resolvase